MVEPDGLKLPIVLSVNIAEPDPWDSLPQIVSTRPFRWDFGGWGDSRTWAILFAMFFFGIALAGIAYIMPHGRDAAVPAIHVY